MFQNNSKFRLCKLLSFYLFCLGTHGTKLRNFGENLDMTERKKKSFRPFHYKRGTESFVCFLVRVHPWFSVVYLREMRDPKKFLNNVGRGILSQSRMHVIKNFPGDLTLDPSISMSPLTEAYKCLSEGRSLFATSLE